MIILIVFVVGQQTQFMLLLLLLIWDSGVLLELLLVKQRLLK